MKLLALTLASLILSGCVSQIPFTVVKYEGKAPIQTENSVSVHHTDVDVAKSYSTFFVPIGVPFAFMPITTTPSEEHQFNKGHQAELTALLRSELGRIMLFRKVEETGIADIAIRLEYKSIVRGLHNSFAMNLRMDIKGGKEPFSKTYFLVSDEGDPFFEKINTNASDGKIKLVRRALNALIPDIQKYVESAAY